MELIYRGTIYDYTPAPKHTLPPRAVNWRYQLPDKSQISSPRNWPEYRQPAAINWRYQIQD